MPDIAAIGAILTSVKTATEITKNLRDIDVSLEKAELKLKLAELMEALADVRMEAVGIQDEIAAKDKQIAALEEAFQEKSEVERYRDAMYRKDENGKPVGAPHCLKCWQVKHKLFEMQTAPKDRHVRLCVACGAGYDNMMTQTLQPDWYKPKE